MREYPHAAAMKDKIQQLIRYRELKALYLKYERLLIPGMLVFGVIVDTITFRSINIRTAFTILIMYAIIAGMVIVFLNIQKTEEVSGSLRQYFSLAAPLVLQFTFGALLSASLIFYWFSGALSVSWPVLLLIAFLMVGNDVFRHYYLRPVVQISVYYFILFSLASVMLPYALNSISAWVFVGSGALSLFLIYEYLRISSRWIPHIWRLREAFVLPIVLIFIGMNLMYFFNLIPPIPLSLTEADVCHNVVRVDGDYALLAEKESFFARIMPGTTIHVAAGEPVFIFSSVFAPADLNTRIVHRWQRYDEGQGKWIDVSEPSFPVSGGREDGYRGFSHSSNVSPGRWRVDVTTERGQVLGRIRFRVERTEGEAPKREVIIR
jgi:hypothetical protein